MHINIRITPMRNSIQIKTYLIHINHNKDIGKHSYTFLSNLEGINYLNY